VIILDTQLDYLRFLGKSKGVLIMNAKWEHLQSLQILKCLAIEIQGMSEFERLKTLELMVRAETEGRGSQAWMPIVKALLSKPELLPLALSLVRRELANFNMKQN
jgi:hypothetical protein